MDGLGSGPSAVDRVRSPARRGRDLHERHNRDDLLHAVRLHGVVPARRLAVSRAVLQDRSDGTGGGVIAINDVWFVVLAFMLAVYAVLDGFDLGIGTIHLLLGRTREERARLIDSIGPVWNGNEVWLIAAGGSMVVAFPTLYATSFSGFYLALMLVLWLLLLRGLGIEFPPQIHHPVSAAAGDVVFSGASALLALLFGVALGNVLRGVPFDADGTFRGTFAVILNPFALLGGVLSVVTLSLHGACWAALKTDGALQARARRFASALWASVAVTLLAMILARFIVRPGFTRNFATYPLLWCCPVVTVGSFVVHRRAL